MNYHRDADEQESKHAVSAAIDFLTSRGRDVNPYSVASQGNVPRAQIMRSSELLELINRANRTAPTESEALEAATAQTAALADSQALQIKLDETLAQNQTMQQQLTRLEIINESLRQTLQAKHADSEDLRASLEQTIYQLDSLHLEYEKLAQTIQLAWQQGFAIGQSQGQSGQPSATTYDTSTDSTNNDSVTETHELPYVGDVSINLDDPEVRNDPFTAKLLNALQADGSAAETAESTQEPTTEPIFAPESQELQGQPTLEAYEHAYRTGIEDMGHGDNNWREPASADHLSAYMNDQAIDQANDQSETMATIPGFTPEQIAEAQQAARQGEITQNFTAEDLHTLFRNRYVKEEDAESKEQSVPAAAVLTGATTKKFVGTNRSTSEPLPTTPRVHPPEIRKASRLLGLNLEEANLTRATVVEAWKREMAKPGVHPDTGGDTEMAIYLNTAKDTLIRYVDDLAPKLGKKLGGQQTKEQPKPQQQKQE